VALPADLTTITLTGTAVSATGAALNGTIIITPSATITDSTGHVIISPQPITQSLVNGAFSISGLVCTDNANIAPSNWTYTIIFQAGPTVITGSYLLPHTLGSSVDFSTLVVTTPLPNVSPYAVIAGANVFTQLNTFSAGIALGTTTIALPPGGTTAFLRADGTWAVPLGAVQIGGDLGGTNSSPQVISTHLSSPLPFAQGGTSAGTQQAAINALTGAQSSGRYLRSDGTNASLSAILAADLPTGTTAVQGALRLDSTASDLLPQGVANGGQTGLSADGGHGHPLEAWRFTVMAYGAKADGKISNTGATNGTTTVTISESVLTQADVGKIVMVKNALQDRSTSGQTTSVGTITTVNSSTSFTATWNTTPTLTATGLQVLWATDDTVAIQSAIAAATTYAQAHGLAEVFFPAPVGLFYGVGGALKNTDGVNAVYNSQLTIPVNAEHNQGITLVFRGTGDGGQTRYWNTTVPAFSGSPIVSFGVFTTALNQSNNISGNGNPSVIGGPTGKFGYGVGTPTPLYNNVMVVFQDISILTTHCNSGWTYSAANMFGVARFHARNFTYGTTGVIELFNGNNGDFTNVTLLSGGLAIGLLMPSNGNNASNYLNNIVCNGGYTYGLVATEHTVGNDVTILYCWSGICPCGNYNDSGANAVSALHASWFDQLCVEACTFHINVFGSGAAGIGPIVHWTMDTEGTLQFRDNPSNGASLNTLQGEIRLAGSPSAITVTTGTGFLARVIKEQISPGVAGAPPSLVANTAVMNNLWRPATVYLTGGTTVTTIQVSALAGGASVPAVSTVADFTAAGTIATPFPVRVGPGQYIKVNCAVLPTAIWVLD